MKPAKEIAEQVRAEHEAWCRDWGIPSAALGSRLAVAIARAIEAAREEAFEDAAKYLKSRADLLDEHAQIAGQPHLSSGAFIRPFAEAIRARAGVRKP